MQVTLLQVTLLFGTGGIKGNVLSPSNVVLIDPVAGTSNLIISR